MINREDATGVVPQRVFLFLQGPPSALFERIADGLEAAGGRVIRINLNAGDWMFWRRKGALNYRGNLADWASYARRCMANLGVTDVVLTGEERPYHLVALAEARRCGADISVIEMGHLRPDWITLERDGLSSNSHFPIDADHIIRAAENLPEPDWSRRFEQSFFAEASADVIYYLSTVFLWFLYPGYRRHGLFHPLAEYAGWLWRLPGQARRGRVADRLAARLIADGASFFVYPLQLQTDYQLRSHSPYRRQQDAILQILRSFAMHADAETQLVVKLHPLDNGLISWRRFVDRVCESLNLKGRVHVIHGGDLTALIAASRGVVTVNSTAALTALQLGKPVKALGTTIYDIPGLAATEPMDAFWKNPVGPDALLSRAFFKLLAASIHVRGNFYSRAGVEHGAHEIVRRLVERTVNQPDGYVDPAPRRKPAKIDIAKI